MTTKQATSGSDMKITPLKNLNQPDLTLWWTNDVKNAARASQVTYIDDDGNKTSYGNMGLLYSAGVTNYQPPLATETEPRELVVKTMSGKVWPKELVDEMDSELFSKLYATMGSELRVRMSEKFDKEDETGKPPKATELLRYIVSRIKMADPRAQERKAIADLENHLSTGMPPGVTSEQLFEWCDTTEVLNAKCNPGKQGHELIERAIAAMPDEIVENIEIKTEHAGAHSDFHAAQAEWAGVIERHAERETRRASGRAMAAAGNDQGALIKLQQQVELLTAQVASAHAAQGHYPRPSRPSAGHPYHAECGGKHPGGDDECWMLNLNKVPSSMASMLAGLHRKRAAKGLPDMSAKFPPPASGHMVTCVEVDDDDVCVVARASAAMEAVGRGEMLVDSQASVDLFRREHVPAGLACAVRWQESAGGVGRAARCHAHRHTESGRRGQEWQELRRAAQGGLVGARAHGEPALCACGQGAGFQGTRL